MRITIPWERSPFQLQSKDIQHLSRTERRRAKAAHNRFIQIVTDPNTSPREYDGLLKFRYIYTCNNGVNWYAFDGDAVWDDIPKEKRDYINMTMLKIKYSDNPAWHVNNNNKIVEAIQKRDYKMVETLALEANYKLENLQPEVIDAELSAVLFTADFELQNVYRINPENLQRKKELIQNDLQLRQFFFHFAQRYLRTLTNPNGQEFKSA